MISPVRVYSINNKKYSNPSFKSRVVSDFPAGSATERVKALVDIFEEKPGLFKKLGEGDSSQVYLLDESDKLVIKKSQAGKSAINNKFEHEAEILQSIPSSFWPTQRFKSRVLTENGKYYLISTFVPGKKVDYNSNPLDYVKMCLIGSSLSDLDCNNIYHNDLSFENLLINDDLSDANVVDYQLAKRFKPYEDNSDLNIYFPKTIIPGNYLNFEEFSYIPYLLKYASEHNIRDTRNFFKDYLNVKSYYHDARFEHFKIKAIKEDNNFYNKDGSYNKRVTVPLMYEEALAMVYEHPNDDVIDLELLKMDFLYSHKKSYSFTDPNNRKNINNLNAYPYLANTVMTLSNFYHKLCEYEETNKDTRFVSKYIQYNKDFAEYYANLYKKWLWGTFNYLMDLTAGLEKINQTRPLGPKANKTYVFEKFQTLAPLIRDRSKQYNLNLKVLGPSRNEEIAGYVSDLNDALQGLYGQKAMKSYVAKFDQDKNIFVYDQIRIIYKQISQSIQELNQGKPINAIMVGLNARLLNHQLFELGKNSKGDEFAALRDAAGKLGFRLEHYLIKVQSEIMELLNFNHKYRVSEPDDGLLTYIADN